MSIFNQQIISERTIFIWLAYTFVTCLAAILLAGVIVYFLYDCWPVTRYQPGSSACLAKIQPGYLVFAPMVLGVILGVILTWRAVGNKR